MCIRSVGLEPALHGRSVRIKDSHKAAGVEKDLLLDREGQVGKITSDGRFRGFPILVRFSDGKVIACSEEVLELVDET